MAQHGFIYRQGDSWFLQYRDTCIVDGVLVRKQKCKRLAAFCDQYRTEKDLEGLKADILNPINSGKARPESSITVAEFAEKHWLPWARENCKPSTVAGYETMWNTYLAPHLQKLSLRDFRTVDAAKMFAEIHRQKKIGRTTLQHCKSGPERNFYACPQPGRSRFTQPHQWRNDSQASRRTCRNARRDARRSFDHS